MCLLKKVNLTDQFLDLENKMRSSVESNQSSRIQNNGHRPNKLYHITNNRDESLQDKLVSQSKNNLLRREKAGPSDMVSVHHTKMSNSYEELNPNNKTANENFRLPQVNKSEGVGGLPLYRNHSLSGGMTSDQYIKLRNNGYLSGKIQSLSLNILGMMNSVDNPDRIKSIKVNNNRGGAVANNSVL